jgi:hypothetical protein
MKQFPTVQWFQNQSVGCKASCHVGHTGAHLIHGVKQPLARLVLKWVTVQMAYMTGAVRRCTRILWPVKASEKTPRGDIPPVCVIYRRTS